MSSPPGRSSSDQHPLPFLPADSKTNISTVTPEVQRAMSDSKHDHPIKEAEWVSGLQLWILMLPLSCVFFLILLDTSIIATVSQDLYSLSGIACSSTYHNLLIPPYYSTTLQFSNPC
jgi:hypothetical protein